MNEKQLRRLKKVELLEIMLAQGRRIDELEGQLALANQQLEDKRLKIEKAGSLAEASLQLTAIFEEAQRACDIYLTNLKERVEGGDGDEMVQQEVSG